MNRFAEVFGHVFDVDDELVEQARAYLMDQAASLACLINRLRSYYHEVFDPTVEPVTPEQVRKAASELFSDYPRALNVACLMALAFSLRGTEDYEVFVVDEFLGTLLAETVAGGEPYRSFARGNFSVYDITMKSDIDDCFGSIDTRQLAVDDALAGLAAGFEAIIPGWEWMTRSEE